jgi:hypothetical protein
MTISKINCDECRFYFDLSQRRAALAEEVAYKCLCVGLGFTCSPKCFSNKSKKSLYR